MTQAEFRRKQYVEACELKAKIEAEMRFDQYENPPAAVLAPPAPAPSPGTDFSEYGPTLTAEEAAKICKVSVATMKRQGNNGTLPRVGKKGDRPYLFRTKVVERYILDKQRAGGKS